MEKTNKNEKTTRKYKAFSLIETLFAILLITTGILTTMGLVGTGMAVSIDARNQLIAVELAQEGVELARNIRDNNWENNVGTFDSITAGANCRVDKTYNYPNPIVCNGQYRLYLDGNGFYTHNSAGTPTRFYRKLDIGNGTDNRSVISMVTWDSRGTSALPNDAADCDTVHKCAYAEVVLSRWGE
ncbi:MAG: hypothetical protein U0944_03515 [Candidatus Moranbacteria bacterium]|nr:hypothetical protein [Candidatus Moranbacteria bacterium]MDZ4385462.1 hypothetical protein [Candidatus Moranbacteria bacterium]